MTAVIIPFSKRGDVNPLKAKARLRADREVISVLEKFPEHAKREVERAMGDHAMESRLLDAICEFLYKLDTKPR